MKTFVAASSALLLAGPPRPRGSRSSATPASDSATTSTTTARSAPRPTTTAIDTPDDLRAISRVRFGVNMTGETDSGITFGATIRADNAAGGQGGTVGQTAGSVFVSGSWGTLTYGDTNGADEQWVGDVPGDYSLTGLGDLDETRFISNGGSFGGDGGENFADEPGGPSDGPLRLRHRRLRHVAVVEPRPDRHRRRHRLLGATSAAAAGPRASATTSSNSFTAVSDGEPRRRFSDGAGGLVVVPRRLTSRRSFRTASSGRSA